MTLRTTTRWLTGLAVAAALTGASADDDVLAQAQALIQAGRMQQAYEVLAPQAESRAGDPNFDFLLGRAALESGRATEAAFAFERVLDVQPDNGPARAELARAYSAVGALEAARKELETVRQQPVPPEVAANIDRYLAALQYRFDISHTRFYPFVQMGVGYDTNVNGATDRDQVAVPALGGLLFTLADSSRESESPIWDLATGFKFTSPLRSGVNLFGGADYDFRNALEESDFTTKTANGFVGVHLLQGQNQFRLTGQAQKFSVRGNSLLEGDRNMGGITGQWQHNFDAQNQLTAFAQASFIRYDDQEVRDVNRFLGGVGYGHAFAAGGASPVVFLSVFGGTEDAVHDAAGGHFGRDLVGVRLGGQFTVMPKLYAHGTMSYQYSKYDEDDPAFLERRKDDFFDAGVGLRYQYNRNWSVRPELRYVNNDSNIALTDYDRFEAMLTVRNDF